MTESLTDQHELVQSALNGFAKAIPLQLEVFEKDESNKVVGITQVELHVALGVEEESLLTGRTNHGLLESILSVITKDPVPYARVTIPNIPRSNTHLPVIAFGGIDTLATEHSLTPFGGISYDNGANGSFSASRIYTPR